MKTKRILLALAATGFALRAFAQEHATTDVGTLDSETTAKVFPAKPPYSPYAGRNFPTRPLFLNPQISSLIPILPSYAIGAVAMFWVIQRIAAF